MLKSRGADLALRWRFYKTKMIAAYVGELDRMTKDAARNEAQRSGGRGIESHLSKMGSIKSEHLSA